MSLDFKVESKDWSWRLEPYWTLAVYDGLVRVAEIPAPFLMELIQQRLREVGLLRRLGALTDAGHVDRLMRDLEPRRLPDPTPVAAQLTEITEPFGAPLRRARAAAGLTVAELAAKVGYSESHLRALEVFALPSPKLAAKLAQVFDTTPEELWPGVTLKHPSARPPSAAAREARRETRRARAKGATA